MIYSWVQMTAMCLNATDKIGKMAFCYSFQRGGVIFTRLIVDIVILIPIIFGLLGLLSHGVYFCTKIRTHMKP